LRQKKNTRIAARTIPLMFIYIQHMAETLTN